MSAETDAQIERAREVMARISGGRVEGPAPRRPRGAARRRLKVAAAFNSAVLLVAGGLGLVSPIGLFGVLAAVLMMIVGTLVILGRAAPPAPSPEKLRVSDVKVLPAQTVRWLDAQRSQLPAPAAQVADRIAGRLEVLSPQLAGVAPDGPEAAELRKLVGEQLPALVGDHARVPAPLRSQARNGRTPDAELVDGLTLIEQELGNLTRRLAAGDLDQLQTRGRYLELRYRNDAEG